MTSSKEVLREDLRVRASNLTDACLERTLKRFALAAAKKNSEAKTWLESLLMIVSDKPAESWTDNDAITFESKISDLAQRFIDFEALQKGMAASMNKGFDARRITIARPDGYEVHQLLWIDSDEVALLKSEVTKIFENPIFRDGERLKQGLASLMVKDRTSEDVIPISIKSTSPKLTKVIL